MYIYIYIYIYIPYFLSQYQLFMICRTYCIYKHLRDMFQITGHNSY